MRVYIETTRVRDLSRGNAQTLELRPCCSLSRADPLTDLLSFIVSRSCRLCFASVFAVRLSSVAEKEDKATVEWSLVEEDVGGGFRHRRPGLLRGRGPTRRRGNGQ